MVNKSDFGGSAFFCIGPLAEGLDSVVVYLVGSVDIKRRGCPQKLVLGHPLIFTKNLLFQRAASANKAELPVAVDDRINSYPARIFGIGM